MMAQVIQQDGLGSDLKESHREDWEVRQDSKIVPQFRQAKLEAEAQKSWDLFYKRNATNFYKDRHWTSREFSELLNGKLTVLETGCGVGNFVFPLLEENSDLFFYCCDFSARAIEYVKANPAYATGKCEAFQCDLTKDDLSAFISGEILDFVTMIFVLSAIHPDKMSLALANVYKVLKPGGSLLFRDYGFRDHAMKRFAPGSKLADNFYVRQDNTRAYYFSEEILTQLVVDAGFVVTECSYVHRRTVNHKEGIDVARIFVQGKFTKPETIS